MSDTVRDDLAQVVASTFHSLRHLDVKIEFQFADAILASGVLDQIKADAWDEGKESGHDANCRLNAEPYSCICVNPYRKEGATT